MKFPLSDVLLLQSIMLANVDGVGSIERILAAADLLNKTPMTDTDLRGGLARLTQNGFITEHDKQFSPAARVPADLKWGEREKIRELLTTEPPAEEKKVNNPQNILKFAGLTRDRIQNATNTYVKRVQKYVADLARPKKE